VQSFQRWHFRAAGRAPNGPEIKKHDLASEIIQADETAGGILQLGLKRIGTAL